MQNSYTIPDNLQENPTHGICDRKINLFFFVTDAPLDTLISKMANNTQSNIRSLATEAMKNRIRENGDITTIPDGGGTMITGEGIALYRLLSVASQASLQLVGFKTRGGSLFPRIKRGEFDGRKYKGKNIRVLQQFCDFHGIKYPPGLRRKLEG
jgi:hypothetical protein